MKYTPTPIDVSKINLDKLKDKITDLPGLIEYAHSVGGFSIVPTKEGVIKCKAISAMKEQTQEKLDIILEQMRVLAKQANEIKDRVEVSQQIYQAAVGFQPDIGQIYYLYQRNNGERLLSLVGPAEWNKPCPFKKSLAKVKLLSDHTWKILERYPEKPD